MTHGGSAQGPYTPTIDSVNPQSVTVIIYQHSPSLVNMQKKKKKKEEESQRDRERKSEGVVGVERELERRFLFHMKTRMLWRAYYIILFYNFSYSYCFELQRTFCQEQEVLGI